MPDRTLVLVLEEPAANTVTVSAPVPDTGPLCICCCRPTDRRVQVVVNATTGTIPSGFGYLCERCNRRLTDG